MGDHRVTIRLFISCSAHLDMDLKAKVAPARLHNALRNQDPNEQSPRRDDFRFLSVPPYLAAQPGGVLVQDPVRRTRAQVPILNPPQYSPDLFVDRARTQFRVRDRDHFA
jgi:hypothetical protein